MSALFKDQFSKTIEWFSSWNECEQIVALYNLIKKMTPSQACFLSKVLPQLPSSNSSSDIELLEYQANDPTNLKKERPDTLMKELVKLLPLLRPGSFLAAKEYVKLTSFVVTSPSLKTIMIDDLYQIIFYLSLHPSVSKEDWHHLYLWKSNLEELSTFGKVDSLLPLVQISDASLSQSVPDSKEFCVDREFFNTPECFMGSNYSLRLVAQDAYIPRKTSNSLSLADEGVLFSNQIGNKGRHQLHAVKSLMSSSAPKHHQALTRTASISSYPSCSDWVTHNALKGSTQRNQTYLSADHAPLSPQSSGASTGSVGSDLHNPPEDVDPAMIDISMWLKSLRLHKYLFIFEKLSYNEMMELTEDWLTGQGVTKGARNKIILNIKKLKERSDLLRTVEKNILSGQDLGQCISDLKPIIFAPISTTSKTGNSVPEAGNSLGRFSSVPVDENLPSQISRVLGKRWFYYLFDELLRTRYYGHGFCSQLLVSSCPETDCLNNYLQLLERCSVHHSFTEEQRRKITFWKQQMQNTWGVLMSKHSNRSCKTSLPQNLPLPLNKTKSKLTMRCSNPIVTSQSCLSLKPPLVSHHLPKVTRPTPQIFSSPQPSIFSAGAMANQAHRFQGIPRHHQPDLLFASQISAKPPQMNIDSQDCIPYILDDAQEAVSLKIPLGRTQSAPLSSPALHKSFIPPDAPDNEVASSPTTEDIHANLESLCINMMEHALGNSND